MHGLVHDKFDQRDNEDRLTTYSTDFGQLSKNPSPLNSENSGNSNSGSTSDDQFSENPFLAGITPPVEELQVDDLKADVKNLADNLNGQVRDEFVG